MNIVFFIFRFLFLFPVLIFFLSLVPFCLLPLLSLLLRLSTVFRLCVCSSSFFAGLTFLIFQPEIIFFPFLGVI